MPWMRGLFFSILFSALCLSQQAKTDSDSQKTASISGTVLQSTTRAPLKNVEVAILHNAGGDAGENEESSAAPELTVKTDQKGHFQFSKLEPGPYFIRASHAGMVMKSHHSQEGMFVNLEAGKTQTLDLLMLPTAVIAGQILNEEGEPMQHVSVMAMRYGYTITGRQLAQAATASSDDEGRFRLFGLQPGSYLVSASPVEGGMAGGMVSGLGAFAGNSAAPSKQNQTVYTTTYYPNETAPESATPIVVKAGDAGQANFTLTRVRAYSVSGTVAGLPPARSADDKPEQNFRMVMAMREGSFMPASMAFAGKDSAFKFPSLPAGRYKLVAMQASGSETSSTGSADVVVESSDVTGLVIGAQSSSRELTGKVRSEGDSKLDFSKLYVMFAPESDPEQAFDTSMVSSFFGGTSGSAQVKDDGSFKVSLAPSAKPYNVVLTAHGTGLEDWFTSKVLFGGKDVLESGFKPGAGQAGPVEIVISNKGSGIEGSVLDKDEKPFPGADVVAFPSDPKLRRHSDMAQTTTADQHGHFSMRGLRPGEYVVFALEDSQEQSFTTALFQKTNSGKIQTVKLEGAQKQQVQLEVIRQGQ